MHKTENDLKQRGYQHICGVDEAGRGPLAGPVVAAAVIMPEGYKNELINDSKKLTAMQREQLFVEIKNIVSKHIHHSLKHRLFGNH